MSQSNFQTIVIFFQIRKPISRSPNYAFSPNFEGKQRKTLYILDEPTTGLHFDDVKKLLKILHTLVDEGNTVIVIEHNLDVIKTADHIIDLGPLGGVNGGQIVGTGTPEDIANNKKSFTGEFLKKIL